MNEPVANVSTDTKVARQCEFYHSSPFCAVKNSTKLGGPDNNSSPRNGLPNESITYLFTLGDLCCIDVFGS
jgi:hypothetical protein